MLSITTICVEIIDFWMLAFNIDLPIQADSKSIFEKVCGSNRMTSIRNKYFHISVLDNIARKIVFERKAKVLLLRL